VIELAVLTPMKPSVLIVDDEAGVRSALSGVLRDEGYASRPSESARPASSA
jgi:DNA-binding NtrC family response regulator